MQTSLPPCCPPHTPLLGARSGALPTQLPDLDIDEAELQATNYGLASIIEGAEYDRVMSQLDPDMNGFLAWARSPIQLDRPPWIDQLGAVACNTTRSMLLGYFGFIYKHLSVHTPMMVHCTYGRAVVHFTSFLICRKVGNRHINACLMGIERAAIWVSRDDWDAIDPFIKWIRHLRTQIAANRMEPCEPKTAEDLKAEGRWLEPEELLSAVMVVVDKAKAAVESGERTAETAQLLHDALFCGMIFGLTPPTRPQVVVSLTGPWDSSPCANPDCQLRDTCPGNSIALVPGGWGFMVAGRSQQCITISNSGSIVIITITS